MNSTRFSLLATGALLLLPPPAGASPAKTVTQYGITWTFDKAYPVGQFVTGDWWVVGPVMVVSVSPATGPAPADEPSTEAKSRYGDVSLVDDRRCRNGSMIFTGPTADGSFGKQGYDSRAISYDPALTVAYPCALPVNRSLISTVSTETYQDGKLSTQYLASASFPDQLKGLAPPVGAYSLETAAVLTCLDKEPPADAFRPAYAGTDKTIYRAGDIRWDLLPTLAPSGPVPDWGKMARLYQRPWLDHSDSWTVQFCSPAQNQAAYGGVVTYLNAYASLLLMLDVPREQKKPLLLGYLQYGIDLRGVAGCGRQWFSDGGHWIGRKWPILFASLVLDQLALRTFPQLDPATTPLYGRHGLGAAPDGVALTTIFSEDMDTYYGRGADGQNVLWQVGFHTHARAPYQEKPFAEWNADDKFANTYLWVPGNWPAFALAALQMKAKAAWNHDAFFDYCDWWMAPGSKKYYSNDGHTGPTRNNTDRFVQAMWDAHRPHVPAQSGGVNNLKWEWTDGKLSADGQHFHATKGHFVLNPKQP